MKTILVAISGNTYPVKEQLKALGAHWNPDRKVWMVAADKAEQAKALVSAGKPATTTRTRRQAPKPSPWDGKKYQVRIKPTTKYAPLFGADTLDEVVAWMDATLQWRYCGTGVTFQCRTTKNFQDVAVCTLQERLNGSGEYFVTGWYPCPEDYDLCHRVTPGQSVGMGAS